MKKMLSLLLMFVLLAACLPGQVFADVMINNEINNQIKNGEGNTFIVSPAPSRESGYEMIVSTGDQYIINMPNYYAYIQPISMYVDAPGDHSIYVYQELDCDKEKLQPFAFEGMRVTAVAEQKAEDGITAMSCIVYRDESFRLRAGWVHSKYLTLWFPGEVDTIGIPYTGTVYSAGDPVLSWGRDYFVGTKQKYTVLTNPVHSCTQFQLGYQVTDRGGAKTEEVLGPRTIYVNDGSGWTLVGQFGYPKIQSMLITVNLPDPMDLVAVAVIPTCSQPDKLTFRMTVQDVLSASADTTVIGSGPVQSSGKPQPQMNTVIVNTPSNNVNIRKGSIVAFGNYEQDIYRVGGREPIEWIVLEEQDDKLFLVSRYALDYLSYCSRQDTVAWETSKVRAWLNDQFLNAAFTSEEQSHILLTEVDNSKSQGYIHYEGDGGYNTWDQIFLLSYAEAWRYFYQSSDRGCRPTKVAVKRGAFESELSGNCPWWLRSPGYTKDYVCAVDVDGNRGGNIKYGALAIRPAMWVEKSAVY